MPRQPTGRSAGRRSYPPSVFAPQPSYLVFDDFNRANGAIGTATSGHTWQIIDDDGSGVIETHMLRPGWTTPWIDAGQAYVTVSATVAATQDGGGLAFWLHLTNPVRRGLLSWFRADPTLYVTLPVAHADGTIFHSDALISYPLAQPISAGDVIGCKLTTSHLTVLVNNAAVGVYAFSSLPAGETIAPTSRFGAMASSLAERLDNFTVAAAS